MTTRIIVTNMGPENAAVWYYTEDRVFKKNTDHLKPGESIEMNIWNGNLPVILPLGHVTKELTNTSGKFHTVPPATY